MPLFYCVCLNISTVFAYPGLSEEELTVQQVHGSHLFNLPVHPLPEDGVHSSGDVAQHVGGRLDLVQEGIDVQRAPGQCGPSRKKAPVSKQ